MARIFKSDAQRKAVMCKVSKPAVSKLRSMTSRSLKVRPLDIDFWGRDRYINVFTGKIYADVDGVLHTITEKGEPDCPIKNKIDIVPDNSTAVSTMKTGDGIIKGDVAWNPFWRLYQVTIDGTVYGQYANIEDGIDELQRSGFKNIKIMVDKK